MVVLQEYSAQLQIHQKRSHARNLRTYFDVDYGGIGHNDNNTLLHALLRV